MHKFGAIAISNRPFLLLHLRQYATVTGNEIKNKQKNIKNYCKITKNRYNINRTQMYRNRKIIFEKEQIS